MNTTPLERAIELCRTGAFEPALKAFAILAADLDQRPQALGHRAWLYRHLGKYEQALCDYDALLALEPANREAATMRAETLMHAGRPEAAAGECAALLQADPLDPRAAAVLVACHEKLGLHAQGRQSAQFPYPPFKNAPENPVIACLEANSTSYPASVYPGLGRLLYALVKCCRPGRMLEIGTYVGYSALCLAQAMEENGVGHLHAFDLFLERPDYISPIAGPCPDPLAAARAHLEHAGLAHRVTFFKGDSSTRITAENAGGVARYDLAFIDGCHTIRGCLKDWQAVEPLMADGGLMLLHDTEPEQCNWLGPRLLLEHLGQHAPEDYHWVNLKTADGCGLALVQKKSTRTPPHWKPALADLARERLFHQILDFKSSR